MTSKKLGVILLCVMVAAFAGGPAAAGGNKHKPPNGNNGWWNILDSAGANDFALFDGSNPLNQPDAGAVCGARKGRSFTYHLAVANYGADGFIRVTYADGDWVQFPIAAGGSFSMSQAAGSRSGNDAAVRVSNGGSGAQLAGTLSAEGGRCASCDADGGIGDTGCDRFVPN
jgi:hypothetical protein